LHAVNSLGEVEGIFGDYLANRDRHLELATATADSEVGTDLEPAGA